MTVARLAALLEAAARGAFPEPDGAVEVLPPPAGRAMAVVGFTAHREGVRVFEDTTGAAVVILGQGLALRTEVAIEVDGPGRGRGLATRALLEARRLVGDDEVLFAQTAPGNAASLRALTQGASIPVKRMGVTEKRSRALPLERGLRRLRFTQTPKRDAKVRGRSPTTFRQPTTA